MNKLKGKKFTYSFLFSLFLYCLLLHQLFVGKLSSSPKSSAHLCPTHVRLVYKARKPNTFVAPTVIILANYVSNQSASSVCNKAL